MRGEVVDVSESAMSKLRRAFLIPPRSARLRVLLLAATIGLAFLGLLFWWKSSESARAVASCKELTITVTEQYEPIRIGPVAFDPGAELASGAQLRWVGRDAAGYIIKSFLLIDPGNHSLVLTGRQQSTGRALLFSYSADGYVERLEIDPASSGWQGSNPRQMRGIPGALAAPDLGAYRVTVRRSDGREWAKTLWICDPINPPRRPFSP